MTYSPQLGAISTATLREAGKRSSSGAGIGLCYIFGRCPLPALQSCLQPPPGDDPGVDHLAVLTVDLFWCRGRCGTGCRSCCHLITRHIAHHVWVGPCPR